MTLVLTQMPAITLLKAIQAAKVDNELVLGIRLIVIVISGTL